MFVSVNTNRKGFSLLELLVAVAVTAILAGMLFNITSQVMKTQTESSADLETNQVLYLFSIASRRIYNVRFSKVTVMYGWR